MLDAELTGRVRTHVAEVGEVGCALHRDAIAPLLSLRRAAAAAGIDVVPVSGFRDFDRQLSIWNGKFSGERPLFDASGALIVAASLPPRRRIEAILRWSALPGASRHHWGTDVDLIDRNAIGEGYRAQLTADEYAANGPFARLSGWLEENAGRFGFFRPYRGALSGVAGEPWHFSFAPVAELARRRLTSDVLRAAIAGSPMSGKEEVLAMLEQLHARYVAQVDPMS